MPAVKRNRSGSSADSKRQAVGSAPAPAPAQTAVHPGLPRVAAALYRAVPQSPHIPVPVSLARLSRLADILLQALAADLNATHPHLLPARFLPHFAIPPDAPAPATALVPSPAPRPSAPLHLPRAPLPPPRPPPRRADSDAQSIRSTRRPPPPPPPPPHPTAYHEEEVELMRGVAMEWEEAVIDGGNGLSPLHPPPDLPNGSARARKPSAPESPALASSSPPSPPPSSLSRSSPPRRRRRRPQPQLHHRAGAAAMAPQQVAPQRLPWWRATEHKVSVPARPADEAQLLAGYVRAVARATVSAEWTARALARAYDADPASARGRGFRAASAALLLMERARHIAQCRLRWPGALLAALQARPEAVWTPLAEAGAAEERRGKGQRQAEARAGETDEAPFVGCEACGKFRPAMARLRLCGRQYDARDFWPEGGGVKMLSMRAAAGAAGQQGLRVEVTVEWRGRGAGAATEANAEKRSGGRLGEEVWVDKECLRKCLVFHELQHMSRVLAWDVSARAEDVVRDGVVTVDGGAGGEEEDAAKDAVEDEVRRRVEETVVGGVLDGAEDFGKKKGRYLHDVVRLGELYLGGDDDESVVLDGGNANGAGADDDCGGAGRGYEQLHDAAMYLGDEQYEACVRRLIASRREIVCLADTVTGLQEAGM